MEHTNRLQNRLMVTGTALLLLGVLFVPGLVGEEGAAPDPQPADRVAVAGSVLEVMSAPLISGTTSEEVTLLEVDAKTSGGGTALVLQFTAECALWTQVMTVGNDDQEAIATVKAWIEINGEPVPVASDDDDETGKIVLCNRAHRQTTSLFENENATIEQFLRTRTANAFNWVALDVGSGTHTIEVKAILETQATDLGDATAAVGKRTLIVDPVKLPPGTEF